VENQHKSTKNPATYLVIERYGGLNFNIFIQNFAQADSTDCAKAEYAVSSKYQVCRHTWYVHGPPQMSNTHDVKCCYNRTAVSSISRQTIRPTKRKSQEDTTKCQE